MLEEYLGREGFSLTVCHDGAEALDHLTEGKEQTPALLILDVMLPSLNGLELLRRLRTRESPPPVLMLTARGDDVDRIAGLELGADDYLSKPFNPRELVARIRAVLRRSHDRRSAPRDAVDLGALHLDPARLRVTLVGRPVELTGAEFRVLEVLARAAGTIVTREQLTEQALGRVLELYDRSIDTHVSNLRKKLGSAPGASLEIRGIRGAGYLLALPTR